MTKLEKNKYNTLVKAVEYYAELPSHSGHDRGEIDVGNCERCQFDCNPQAMAKTALFEIDEIDEKKSD